MKNELTPDPKSGAMRGWFEANGGILVASTRLFVALVIVGVVAVCEGIALYAMAPLKTTVPYIVKVNTDGGVSVEEAAARKYVPQRPEIEYALSKWVRNMLTIDPYLTSNPQRNNVSEAYSMTRDKATEEFLAWFKDSKPIEAITKDPTMTRVVNIRNLLHIQDGAVIARISTETRSMNSKPVTENQMVTIHYSILPPKTQKEILENPLGLVITHFEISKDLT